MNLPNKISSMRETWNLSQDELGLLLNMSRQHVSRIETAQNRCSIETALVLEMLFGVPIVEIFPNLNTALYDALVPRIAALSVLVERDSGDADRKRELMSEFAKRAGIVETA